MSDPKIKLKRSSVEGKIPTPDQVPLGELALNTYDGQLYASKNVGVGTTVIAINPFKVGTGTDSYDAYFTQGNVGIGTEVPDGPAHSSNSSVLNVGVVTANYLYGDGSNISNISGTVVSGVVTNIQAGNGITILESPSGNFIITSTAVGSSATRTVTSQTATAGQTTFSVSYTVNNIDVYLNGAKLESSEFTATNGTSVVLATGATANDVLEFVVYKFVGIAVTATGSNGQLQYYDNGSFSSAEVYYTNGNLGIGTATPLNPVSVGNTAILNVGVVTANYLYGDGSNLTGLQAGYFEKTSAGINTLSNIGIGTTNPTSALTVSGDANVTGVVTATSFVGDGSNLTGLATALSEFTNDVGFVTNVVSGVLTATSFVGDGSNLTGLQAGYFEKTDVGINTLSNIGIGTTNPTSALTVSGDANVTGVVTATSFVGSAANLTSLTGASLGTYGDSGSTPVITIDSNGRITGISTTSTNTGTVTTRSTTTTTATSGQTTFSVTYSVGYVDVFQNGVKLDSTEFTATNGTSVVLTTGAVVDDILEFVAYSQVGLSTVVPDIIGDTTPQLGGNLDLNGNDVTGTGDFNVTGVITATSFVGNITGSVTGDATGLSGSPSITVTDITASGNVSIAGTITYEDVTNVDSVGLITARSGIHVTGGSVGIGTDNPTARLQVYRPTQFAGNPIIQARSNNGSTNELKFEIDGDGDAYFNGSVGIGTDNPARKLHIHENSSNGCFLSITNDTTGSGAGDGALIGLQSDESLLISQKESNSIFFHTSNTDCAYFSSGGTFALVGGGSVASPAVSLNGSAPSNSMVLNTLGNLGLGTNNPDSKLEVLGDVNFAGGLLKEGANITAGKLSDNTNINLSGGMVHLFTTTETTTSTPNLRYDASTSLDSKMSVGESITVVLIVTAAAAGYSAQLTIDGSAVTESWLGGSAPSAGSSSGYDVYTYNIIKTGSSTFVILANLTNFA